MDVVFWFSLTPLVRLSADYFNRLLQAFNRWSQAIFSSRSNNSQDSCIYSPHSVQSLQVDGKFDTHHFGAAFNHLNHPRQSPPICALNPLLTCR